MAACHCRSWWRWWSVTLWATHMRLWLHSLSCYLKLLLWRFLCNCIDLLPPLIYLQVASLSRASSLRKRSIVQGNSVSNLHSNKVFESFSFLKVFKLMVLITGRNQEIIWQEGALSATQKCMVAEVNSHNLSVNVISRNKWLCPSMLCLFLCIKPSLQLFPFSMDYGKMV
jgi:hypothetical protein